MVYKEKGCRRTIESVYLNGNRQVIVNAEEIFFPYKTEIDLALIAVARNAQNDNLFYCSISDSNAHLSEELVGFKAGKDESSFQFVNAFTRRAEEYSTIGTFPGTNGYSGLGYFADRQLVNVHRGKVKYEGSLGIGERGDTDSSKTNEFATSKQVDDACMEPIKNILMGHNADPDKGSREVCDRLVDMIDFYSRNANVESVPARHALNSNIMKPQDLVPKCH